MPVRVPSQRPPLVPTLTAGVSYEPRSDHDARAGRWAALDVARGVAVAGMLVVEQLPAGPGGYPWLRHALWNGWTGADLVFPAFLFLVGISVDQLVGRRGRAGLWRLVKRAVALIVVGVLFNAWAADGADFAQARWPGVLQRIGVVSLACGVIVFVVRRKAWPVLAVAGALLVGYAQLLTRAPLACGAGVLTPACNLPGRIDLAVFGSAHIYHQGVFGHDPEGLLSTLGALATALLGVAVGRLMRERPGWRVITALAAGAALAWLVTHLGLAGPPVNKRLWTPAFVLLTAATSVTLLLVCHAVADVGGAARQRVVRLAATTVSWPWVALGRNALVVYVGQHVLGAIAAKTPAHDGPTATSLAGYLQGRTFAGGWLVLDAQWTYVAAMLLLWSAVAAAMHCARWYVTL
ncbi:MAG TPA: heparan-alpha-glucosaminide N-acetyltransferase domain-containing protein [Acidothermaceae bacterium]